MKKLHTVVFFLTISIIITGCSSAEKNIFQTIEATAMKEEQFEKQQEPIKKLETEEKALYDEIMDIGMNDIDHIVSLADEALANLNKREEYINKEKESLIASKKEFAKTADHIKKIKDEQLKEQAKQLDKIMNDRFDAYDQLYTAYLNGLTEDRKIYEMVKDQELTIDDLQNQIEQSNKVYETVYDLNKLFNEETEKFNQAKLKFYQDSGLEIESKS